MRSRLAAIFSVIRILLGILLLFLATLAPLMFTVGVIATVDRCGAHRRLLNNLRTYGETTFATVSFISASDGYAGVDFYNAAGKERFGHLDLKYYSAPVRAGLLPNTQVQIRYINALISEGETVILAEHAADVNRYFCVTPDLWGTMLFFWLLVMLLPQPVFIGFMDSKTLMDEAFNNLFKKGQP